MSRHDRTRILAPNTPSQTVLMCVMAVLVVLFIGAMQQAHTERVQALWADQEVM